jgi:3-oxoacyl-[acyl-carrier protein] reductase
MTLHGKVGLVTGASRGIGRTIAEHLARNGVSVVVNYYPTEWEDAEDTVRSIKQEGGRAIAVAGDVADAAHVRSLFDITDEHFGRPDIVVLNAADARHAAVVDTSEDLFDAIFAANARGAFLTLRESAVRLRDGGGIVAISTGLSIIPREGTAVYGASKAAVNHLVRVLAREVGPRGITVNSVLPGAVLTQALQDAGPAVIEAEVAKTSLGRVWQPQDIADVVGFLVSEHAGWVTGQLIGDRRRNVLRRVDDRRSPPDPSVHDDHSPQGWALSPGSSRRSKK